MPWSWPAGGPRSQPLGRHHRRPVGQDHGGPRGYDAGKKVKGRKRHALVDTDGRALPVEPHPANIQDGDGGGPVLQASRPLFPFIQRIFADAARDHERIATATAIAVEIVRKPPGQAGLAVLPRRWVVTARTMLQE